MTTNTTTPENSPVQSPVVAAAHWQAAYARVLFAHIDRLNDPCEKTDPLERIVHSLTEAFDAVALTDPTMNSARRAMAPRLKEEWPIPGQQVWRLTGLDRIGPNSAVVQFTFEGRDNRVWCLLEHPANEAGRRYEACPVFGLSPSAEGPGYFDQAMAHPDVARRFLQDAGILDASGALAAPYINEF